MERLIRILRIINIVQGTPGIKARELAMHCETTVRTIYRDLEIISATQIPITNEGHGKGYTFIGNFKQYPINWTEDESNAFVMLPSILMRKYKTNAFDSAYEKVMATYRAEKLERKYFMDDLSKVIQTDNSTSEDNGLLSKISEAILSRFTIEAVYHSHNSNTTKKRRIDPYFLIPRKNRLYIIGYCHDSNEVRTFRLNRFLEVMVLNNSFIRDNINLSNYLKYTWSIIRGNQFINFKIKFSKNVARYIKEDEYNVTPKFMDQPDGSLLFEVTVNDDREFLNWVMQYGPDAEIIELEEYRVRMRNKLKSWNDMYQ